MTVETVIERAQKSVQQERDSLDAEIDAFERFEDRVAEVSPVQHSTQQVITTVGTQSGSVSSTGGCEAVRTAFAETIAPHTERDALLEAIRDELTESIATALAQTTAAPLSPRLKRGILDESRRRKRERQVQSQAIERETAYLADVSETVTGITSWILSLDSPTLLDSDYSTLRTHHETLATHRETCTEYARDRQSFLRESTSDSGTIGLRHRNLVQYLYTDLDVAYPVLSAVTRLDSACEECQRLVRDHLTRRV